MKQETTLMDVIVTDYNPMDKKQLAELSSAAKPFLSALGVSVNEWLLETYENAIREQYGVEHVRWDTFKGWKEQGRKVRKGEKAFRVWSRPKFGAQKGEEKIVASSKAELPVDADKKWTAYFTACLFADVQTEEI